MFSEPRDAALPTKRWKLYIFKGNVEIGLQFLLLRY